MDYAVKIFNVFQICSRLLKPAQAVAVAVVKKMRVDKSRTVWCSDYIFCRHKKFVCFEWCSVGRRSSVGIATD